MQLAGEQRAHGIARHTVEIPEEHVGDVGGRSHVGGDEVANVSRSHIWKSICLKFLVVDCVVGVQDHGLVVLGVVGVVGRIREEDLRQEGEVLGSEGIPVVQAHEEDGASDVADETVHKCLQRHPQGRLSSGDIVPVKAD